LKYIFLLRLIVCVVRPFFLFHLSLSLFVFFSNAQFSLIHRTHPAADTCRCRRILTPPSLSSTARWSFTRTTPKPPSCAGTFSPRKTTTSKPCSSTKSCSNASPTTTVRCSGWLMATVGRASRQKPSRRRLTARWPARAAPRLSTGCSIAPDSTAGAKTFYFIVLLTAYLQQAHVPLHHCPSHALLSSFSSSSSPTHSHHSLHSASLSVHHIIHSLFSLAFQSQVLW
jgi:hypothetical protein